MDEQQTQRINQAAKEFSDAFAASYRALSNRTVSTQEQSAQLTQEFFKAVIDNLRAQEAQGNQEMVQELVDQQQQQQRKSAQALAQQSVEGHMRLLDYMFSYYRTECMAKEVGVATQETTGKIDPERVLERVRQAFAERDPKAWMEIYADDAELQVVDCNTPPSSPRVLRGKEEIAAYWRDVLSRQMTHDLQDEVVGEDRMACNLVCEYPDGTKVLATMMFDLREGKISRQVDVLVWDE